MTWLNAQSQPLSVRGFGHCRTPSFLRRLLPLLILPVLASCGESGPTLPAALQIVAGDGQSGTVGQAVAQSLQVRVVDAGGNAIADVTVNWSVTAGGGSLGQSSTVSGADGVASVTWTLGTEVGAQRATAEAGGASTIFSATAAAGPPATVRVTPADAAITALNGTVQMMASLADEFGNPLNGGDFQWASGDEAVVTMAPDGVATGLARGEAEVTATDLTSSLSGSTQVEVTQVPSTVSVSPQDATVAVDGLLGLTAVVADAGGSAIPDAEVGWTSSDESVVTVDGSGVATGVAEGEATVTATAGNATGETEVTVVLTADDFAPVSDTQVEGDLTVGELTVPAGVTLTFTADATITALGDVNIAGSLVGSCVQMAVAGQGAATYSGTFDNSCPQEPEEGGPDMTLVNAGPLTVEGTTFVYAGELDIRNGPPLEPSAAAAEPAGEAPSLSFIANSPTLSPTEPARANGLNACVVAGATFRPSNPAARDGVDGTSGAQSGANARGVRLSCTGDLVMRGGATGTTVEARDGGAGGDAENLDPQTDNASGNGADGGNGGDMTVEADGDITFDGQGGGTTIQLSSGGEGGHGTVLGRDPGGNATADGGEGGDGGNVRVEATGGITVSPGGLTLLVGVGGAGGKAIANAGNGRDAGESAATAGGSATATGGVGGSSVEGRLRASGDVAGVLNINITGGHGGPGGDATAVGGKGGDGNLAFPDGAKGGSMAANGGKGGEARTKGPLGTVIGTSGKGGNIRLVNGRGGMGADRCSIPNTGGNGGRGGDGSGAPGEGGGGDNPGNPGSISVAAATGNGGDGDDGKGPGVGGDGGTDGLAQGFARVDEGPVFQAGVGGEECPEEPPVEAEADPSSMDVPQGVVPPGDYQIAFRDATNAIVGFMIMRALGPTGNAFWALNPPRFGWAAPYGWLILLNTLETLQPGLGLQVLTVCFLNTFPTEEDPAVVESQNSEGETLGTHNVTSEGGCTEITPAEGVSQLRIRGRPSGFSDARFRARFLRGG
ncbi:MAG: Ig-like domain-containing protein [Gemmatimonadota bacterium]